LDTFSQIFATLLTVGGAGIINYIIAEQLSAIDPTQQGTNREKALAIMFTMFDYWIYLLVKKGCSSFFNLKGTDLLIITVAVTLIISLVISLLFSIPVNRLFYKIINYIRNKWNLSLRRSATNWQSTFETNGKMQRVYLYDFDHTPLGFGWRVGVSNDKESNYSISFQPAYDEGDQPTYEEITNQIQKDDLANEYDILQYVNFQQKFIAIIANAKN